MPVTQENKREFVQLSAQYRLYSSIKEQIESLLGGFYEIIPKDLITIVSFALPCTILYANTLHNLSSTSRSSNFSFLAHLISMWTNGELQRNIMVTTALIQLSYGGGEPSSLLIATREPRSSVLRPVPLEFLLAASWICKVSRVCRDSRSIEHMENQTDCHRLIHVSK